MYPVDLHIMHTVASTHAYSTPERLYIAEAKRKGIKLFAIPIMAGPTWKMRRITGIFINMRIWSRLADGVGILRGILRRISRTLMVKLIVPERCSTAGSDYRRLSCDSFLAPHDKESGHRDDRTSSPAARHIISHPGNPVSSGVLTPSRRRRRTPCSAGNHQLFFCIRVKRRR